MVNRRSYVRVHVSYNFLNLSKDWHIRFLRTGERTDCLQDVRSVSLSELILLLFELLADEVEIAAPRSTPQRNCIVVEDRQHFLVQNAEQGVLVNLKQLLEVALRSIRECQLHRNSNAVFGQKEVSVWLRGVTKRLALVVTEHEEAVRVLHLLLKVPHVVRDLVVVDLGQPFHARQVATQDLGTKPEGVLDNLPVGWVVDVLEEKSQLTHRRRLVFDCGERALTQGHLVENRSYDEPLVNTAFLEAIVELHIGFHRVSESCYFSELTVNCLRLSLGLNLGLDDCFSVVLQSECRRGSLARLIVSLSLGFSDYLAAYSDWGILNWGLL